MKRIRLILFIVLLAFGLTGCAALGADWSEYPANAANVKNEYRNCIEAGFREANGIERAEVYSVKDNSLTYIGPRSPEIFE